MNNIHAHAEEDHLARALFAGGCFWCIEAELQELEGVKSVTSGYTGGELENPTYEAISRGDTGHAEAVEVIYDPDIISYEQLLTIYWSNIDPTDPGGQFYDRGDQYRTEIFYLDDTQKLAAETSKMRLQGTLDKPIVTEITQAGPFYPAEDYHQDYYQTNPLRYKAYKQGSRREETLERVWGPHRPVLQKQTPADASTDN